MLLEKFIASIRSFDLARSRYPQEIREVTDTIQSAIFATPQEMAGLREELIALLSRFVDRLDPARRPRAATPSRSSRSRTCSTCPAYPLEPPMRSLLRLRNARIYLLGDVVSSLGDYSLWLAMAIWMKELTGSSAWAGLVMFCFALGNLFSPLGGILADRFRRRPLLIALNLAAAALVLLLLLVHDRSMMWLVYAVMFGYGLVGSAIDPDGDRAAACIVPADLLAEANGAAAWLLTQGLRLVTPLLGAGPLRLGRRPEWWPWWTRRPFSVAAGPRSPAPAPPSLNVRRARGPAQDAVCYASVNEARAAGFRFIAAEPLLPTITITLAVVLLALGFTESAGFSVVTAGLHRSASFVGVLGTVQGGRRGREAGFSRRRCSSGPSRRGL